MRRYHFIDQHRGAYPVACLAQTLGVSRSGYYEWRDRPISKRSRRRAHLAEHVRETYTERQGIYGSRKITEELVDRDVRVCRNTVAELMRRMNLRSKVQRRRSFTLTTDSNHADPIAPNLLKRDFTATAPNEKWVADITSVPTDEGFAYVAVRFPRLDGRGRARSRIIRTAAVSTPAAITAHGWLHQASSAA